MNVFEITQPRENEVEQIWLNKISLIENQLTVLKELLKKNREETSKTHANYAEMQHVLMTFYKNLHTLQCDAETLCAVLRYPLSIVRNASSDG